MRNNLDVWTTVAQFNDSVEAQLLQGRLQAEGIATFLADQQMVQTHQLGIALGGIRVQVAARDVGLAKEVIAALAAGDYALDDDFDPGPADSGPSNR